MSRYYNDKKQKLLNINNMKLDMHNLVFSHINLYNDKMDHVFCFVFAFIAW